MSYGEWTDLRGYNYLRAVPKPFSQVLDSSGNVITTHYSTYPMVYNRGESSSIQSVRSGKVPHPPSLRLNPGFHRILSDLPAEEPARLERQALETNTAFSRRRLYEKEARRMRVAIDIHKSRVHALTKAMTTDGTLQRENPVDLTKVRGTSDALLDYLHTYPESIYVADRFYTGYTAATLQGAPQSVSVSPMRSLLEACAIQRAYGRAAGRMEFQGVTFLKELSKTVGTYSSVVVRGMRACVRQRAAWKLAAENYRLWLKRHLNKIWIDVSKANSKKFKRYYRHGFLKGYSFEVVERWNRVANLLLEFQFGIMGLVRDVCDFSDAWQEVVYQAARHPTIRVTGKHGSDPYVLLETQGELQSVAITRRHTATFRTSTRSTAEAKAAIVLRHPVPLHLMKTFGASLADLPSQIWEMTRWSFVVDWFIGVGRLVEQYASALTAPDVISSSVTYTQRDSRTVTVQRLDTVYGIVDPDRVRLTPTHTLETMRKIRRIGVQPISFPLPGPVLMSALSLGRSIAGFAVAGRAAALLAFGRKGHRYKRSL